MATIGDPLVVSTHDHLRRRHDRASASLRRLAASQRIERAADDPAGLAMSERLRAEVASLGRSSQNALGGVSLARTADAGLERIGELAGRLKELSVQAGNGTLSDADKQILQDEAEQVLADIDQVAASTDFNGVDLLDGSQASVEVDAGEGSAVDVELGSASASALGLGSLDLTADPSGAIDRVDQAIQAVSARRASLGSSEGRLLRAADELDRRRIELTGAESRIRDLDVAREASRLASARIGADAATAIHAQASLQPRVLLGLLAK